MPADDDDYVVSLLLKDAEANRKRYLTNSLGALISKSRPPNGKIAPKPNTRFLKNIVREADSHNAALKAREEEESRARLRELRREGDGGGKREREGGTEDDRNGGEEGSVKRRRGEDKPGRWASVLGGLGARGEGRREKRGDVEKDRAEERTKGHERSRRERNSGTRDRELDQHRRHHSRSRSPNHQKEHKHRRRRSRSPSHVKGSSTPPKRQQRHNENHDSGSDPLESILGPKPPSPTLKRGRGAHKSSASTNINTRFSPSYNPKADISHPYSDDESGERDDWDMALEALKDRAKWRTHGAERLRAAGFSEEEVGRWERSGSGLAGSGGGGGGAEKDVEDVRWRKEGEGRDWDRGKVVSGDGVELRAEWGRLKGS